MSQDIISLGEVLWDLFPAGEQFGGAPANFASHAANLGASVSMISAIGDDDLGRRAKDALQSYGVDTSMLQTVEDKPTGTVGITLDEAGKPTFEIHRDSAWDHLQWQDDWTALLQKSRCVYFGTLGQRSTTARQAIRRALQVAKEAGAMRIVDINLRQPFFDAAMIRESVELASVLKLSLDELPEICDAFSLDDSAAPADLIAQLRSKAGLDLVVMTNGADGATLATAGGVLHQPGVPAEVVDTVGAGDSFTAAFVTGLLRDDPHPQILEHACKVAATVCGHAGAAPQR